MDLLVVGGPTQSHGISARIRQFLDAMDTRSAKGMVAAAFDTRYRMPEVFSGSVAKTIRKYLRRERVPFIAPPESFFVTRGTLDLEDGEMERAADWAKHLAVSLQLSRWCAA